MINSVPVPSGCGNVCFRGTARGSLSSTALRRRPSWCEVVDRSDNEAVKRGLNVIRGKFAVHPPTLPQFEQAFALLRIETARTRAPQIGLPRMSCGALGTG